MLGGLIAVAIGWGIAAILKATVLDGPVIFWKAFGIGVLVMLPLLAAIPDSSFAPIIGGAIGIFLSQGYTGKSRKKAATAYKAQADSPKQLHPQKPAPESQSASKPVKRKTLEIGSSRQEEELYAQAASLVAKFASKEPVKTEKPDMSNPHDDEQFYEQVAAELKGDNIRHGLWLKAETKAQGDADKTRFLYIEWRVEQLVEEEREAFRQKEVEAEAEREVLRQEEEELLAKKIATRAKSFDLVITTRKDAKMWVAPLARYTYEVIKMSAVRGVTYWRIRSPHLEEPEDVSQDDLVRYVYRQIDEHGYDVRIQNCPKCSTPMEEVDTAVWKCGKCEECNPS